MVRNQLAFVSQTPQNILERHFPIPWNKGPDSSIVWSGTTTSIYSGPEPVPKTYHCLRGAHVPWLKLKMMTQGGPHMTPLQSRWSSQGHWDQEEEGLNPTRDKRQEQWGLTKKKAICSLYLSFFLSVVLSRRRQPWCALAGTQVLGVLWTIKSQKLYPCYQGNQAPFLLKSEPLQLLWLMTYGYSW